MPTVTQVGIIPIVIAVEIGECLIMAFPAITSIGKDACD